jgi:hypothetical protein
MEGLTAMTPCTQKLPRERLFGPLKLTPDTEDIKTKKCRSAAATP